MHFSYPLKYFLLTTSWAYVFLTRRNLLFKFVMLYCQMLMYQILYQSPLMFLYILEGKRVMAYPLYNEVSGFVLSASIMKINWITH